MYIESKIYRKVQRRILARLVDKVDDELHHSGGEETVATWMIPLPRRRRLDDSWRGKPYIISENPKLLHPNIFNLPIFKHAFRETRKQRRQVFLSHSTERVEVFLSMFCNTTNRI